MPAMAALTVKKADGTTDIVYGIKANAAGDGSWAIWRQDTGNTAPAAGRPTFSVRTTESKSAIRRVDLMYVYPYCYTDTTTSQVVISPLAVSFKNGVWTVPQGLPQTVMDEASAQFAGLVKHADIVAGLKNQTSFT
jgi:hypothetical protein